jgi:hypothetical protein
VTRPRRTKPIRPAHRQRFFAAFALGAVLSACAGSPSPSPPRFTNERPAGALEIRLVYGGAADLDLFVTGPQREAVYFGNNPSLGGGELDIDRRCEASEPRTEIVRFLMPTNGQYRVGVSYDRACGFLRQPASYRIEVRADDVEIVRLGKLAPGTFDSVALEFGLE